MKIFQGVLNENLSSNSSLEKINSMCSHNLFEGVNELLLALSVLFDRFLLNSVHMVSMNFNNYEFDGNQFSESHSFLRDVLKFLPLIFSFFLWFGWNLRMCSKQLWVLWSPNKKGRTFLLGVNKVTYSCVGWNLLTLNFKENLIYYVTCYTVSNVIKHEGKKVTSVSMSLNFIQQ
jgi:hypothetical protein